MSKVLEIRRQDFEELPDGRFRMVDSNGMTWYGECHVRDQGPNNHYSVIGTVSTGPAEWVGLNIVVHGNFQGEMLSVEPELLYRKKLTESASRNAGKVPK